MQNFVKLYLKFSFKIHQNLRMGALSGVLGYKWVIRIIKFTTQIYPEVNKLSMYGSKTKCTKWWKKDKDKVRWQKCIILYYGILSKKVFLTTNCCISFYVLLLVKKIYPFPPAGWYVCENVKTPKSEIETSLWLYSDYRHSKVMYTT